MSKKVKIAVVYYSGYNHTHVVAERIGKGCLDSGAEIKLFHLKDSLKTHEDLDELLEYDAMIFGAPTYMGDVAAEFKKFMELSSKPWAEHKWRNKIAAGFTNSSSMSGDKLQSLTSLAIFAAQHGMIWVGNSTLPSGMKDLDAEGAENRLGSWLGLMTQSNASESSDTAPPEVDRVMAEKFGKRIADITKQFKL